MNAVLGIAVAVVVAFVSIIWPMRKAAQLVGADRDGYGTVVLALVLSFVLIAVGGVLAAFAGAGGTGASIGAVVVLVVAMVFLYAKVFGTGFLGGFLIMLIANVIGTVVMIGMSSMLGIAGLFMGGGTASQQLRPVVDQLCECGDDRACQKEQTEALGMAMVRMTATTGGLDAEEEARVREEMARAQACMEGAGLELPEAPGGSGGARSGDGQGASSGGRSGAESGGEGTTGSGSGGGGAGQGTGEAGGSAQGGDVQTGVEEGTGAPQEARRRAPPPSYTRVWQDTSTDELPALMGEVLRFELSDGRQREGILLSVQGGSASLRSLQSRGLSYEVDLGTVKSVKVYTRVLQ